MAQRAMHRRSAQCAERLATHGVRHGPMHTAVYGPYTAKPPRRLILSMCPPPVMPMPVVLRHAHALCSCTVRIVQRKLGWREVGDDEDWEVYWTDNSIAIERVMRLGRTQKINHFSGMLELCRKRSMARNLQKMQKAFPEHYNFFPTTFIIPGDQTVRALVPRPMPCVDTVGRVGGRRD
eukprot:363755-Chlamydomonas_euryale.AAC.2